MTRYTKHPVDNDGWTGWIKPAASYKLGCCDCGLVHDLEFRIGDDGAVRFKARRNERATGQKRRRLKAA